MKNTVRKTGIVLAALGACCSFGLATSFSDVKAETATTLSELTFTQENYKIHRAEVYADAEATATDKDYAGIRFHIVMETSLYNSLPEDAKIYAKLLPEYLLEGDDIESTTKAEPVELTASYWGACECENYGDHMEAIVYLWNIPDTQYGSKVSIVSYVEQGEEKVATQSKSVSMSYVAQESYETSDNQSGLDKYVATLSLDGVETKKIAYGEELTVEDPDVPFVFNGWYNKDGTAKWTNGTKVQGNVSLYADCDYSTVDVSKANIFDDGTKTDGYYAPVASFDGVENVYKYDYAKTTKGNGILVGFNDIFVEQTKAYKSLSVTAYIGGSAGNLYAFYVGNNTYQITESFIYTHALNGNSVQQNTCYFNQWLTFTFDLTQHNAWNGDGDFKIVRYGDVKDNGADGIYIKSIVFSEEQAVAPTAGSTFALNVSNPVTINSNTANYNAKCYTYNVSNGYYTYTSTLGGTNVQNGYANYLQFNLPTTIANLKAQGYKYLNFEMQASSVKLNDAGWIGYGLIAGDNTAFVNEKLTAANGTYIRNADGWYITCAQSLGQWVTLTVDLTAGKFPDTNSIMKLGIWNCANVWMKSVTLTKGTQSVDLSTATLTSAGTYEKLTAADGIAPAGAYKYVPTSGNANILFENLPLYTKVTMRIYITSSGTALIRGNSSSIWTNLGATATKDNGETFTCTDSNVCNQWLTIEIDLTNKATYKNLQIETWHNSTTAVYIDYITLN